MSDISPISRSIAASYTAAKQDPPATPAAPDGPDRGQDKAQFSSRATFLSKLAELPDVRQDLVDRVKAEIAAETYETPEKIEASLDLLGDDLA